MLGNRWKERFPILPCSLNANLSSFQADAHVLCGRGTNCCFWIHGYKTESLWLSNPPASSGGVIPMVTRNKTCGPLAAKLSVVQNGLWWGDTQEMPPLLPLHVRTEQFGNWLSHIWCFQSTWAGSLGTSGQPSCKRFLCVWISLVEIFA